MPSLKLTGKFLTDTVIHLPEPSHHWPAISNSLYSAVTGRSEKSQGIRDLKHLPFLFLRQIYWDMTRGQVSSRPLMSSLESQWESETFYPPGEKKKIYLLALLRTSVSQFIDDGSVPARLPQCPQAQNVWGKFDLLPRRDWLHNPNAINLLTFQRGGFTVRAHTSFVAHARKTSEPQRRCWKSLQYLWAVDISISGPTTVFEGRPQVPAK